jgi:hypothetical protein
MRSIFCTTIGGSYLPRPTALPFIKLALNIMSNRTFFSLYVFPLLERSPSSCLVRNPRDLCRLPLSSLHSYSLLLQYSNQDLYTAKA